MSEELARRAADAVPAGAGPVEVLGDGPLAALVRGLVGDDRAGRRPAAIVDTTGDPAELEGALRRLDDLGTLVLAGPPPPEPLALDLYGDLHVRGLTIVGVPAEP
jgi:threonine dehydrogenase-like Zn-dependent dehydrogenase